ncbi:MAG: hypothetical protein KDA66_11875, partial [Planctomycetaceae bacterium]|nr:hypothetical protein [Planctomycetaceae bacterium]
ETVTSDLHQPIYVSSDPLSMPTLLRDVGMARNPEKYWAAHKFWTMTADHSHQVAILTTLVFGFHVQLSRSCVFSYWTDAFSFQLLS